MKLYLILALISFCFILIQFRTSAQQIKFIDDPDLMEQEIFHYVPLGSSIADAKKTMEQNHFRCKYVKRGSFIKERYDENALGGVIQTSYRNVDFLYCDHSKNLYFVCVRRWQVAVVHNNNKVTQISVSTGLICL